MVVITIKIKEKVNKNFLDTKVVGCDIEATIEGVNCTKAEKDVAFEIKDKLKIGEDEIVNHSDTNESKNIEKILKNLFNK